jgi:hypothetical protein
MILMAGLSGGVLAEEETGTGPADISVADGPAFPAGEAVGLESVPLTPGHLDFGENPPGWIAEIGISMAYEDNKSGDEGEPSFLTTSDLSLGYRGRKTGLFRPILEFGYNLAYNRYWEDSMNEGRDPFENSVNGTAGIQGTKTSVFLKSSFFQNNGYGNNVQRLDRETQLSTSDNFLTDLSVSRKLGRSSLAADLKYRLQNFTSDEGSSTTTGGLSDVTEWDGSLSWVVTPLQTPKLEFRPTIGLGTSRQDSGSDQRYWAPSMNLNYRYSEKTSFFANVGADLRHGTIAVPEGDDQSYNQTSPTYGLGVNWQPASGTVLNANFYRKTSSSAIQGRGSADTTGFSLKASKRFFDHYSTSVYYSYERASYSSVDEGSGGSDLSGSKATPAKNYQRFGADLGRKFPLGSRLNLNASLFYQYSFSDGEDLENDLERSMQGIRFSLAF